MRKTEQEQEQRNDEPKKVVPRGEPIIRTDEEIDDMCSPEAMEALADEAAEDFRDNAPSRYSSLLDAQTAKEQSDA